jgi:hypothetical protein
MGKAGITPQLQLLIFGLEILELIVPISTIIGLAAATCTTTSFLPQVIKAWRSRSTGDVSVGMFALLVTGNSLWAALWRVNKRSPASGRESRDAGLGRHHTCPETAVWLNSF